MENNFEKDIKEKVSSANNESSTSKDVDSEAYAKGNDSEIKSEEIVYLADNAHQTNFWGFSDDFSKVIKNTPECTADNTNNKTDLDSEKKDNKSNIPTPVSRKQKKNSIFNTQKIVGIAIFSALAFVVSLLVRFPVEFLTFDAKDAIITISAFVYGPIAAPIVSFLAAFIELITISDTGWYGFVMNFASSCVYSLTASLIYSKLRSLNGALIGIYSAVALTTAAMMGLNILITPIYMQVYLQVPMDAAGIVAMIPTILLPFNFAKTLLNSAIVMLLYKPLTLALSRLGIGMSARGNLKWTKSSLVILVCGLITLVASVTIFLVLKLM